MKKTIIILCLCLYAFAKAYAQEPLKVTLYWDVSYSMEGRNLTGEFDILSDFFTTHPSAVVNYVSFSNTVTGREQFVVENGDWEALKNTLENVVYDGATNFQLIDFKSGVDHYIVSTDGDSVLNEIGTSSSIPVTIIQSVTSDKSMRLKILANGSMGTYASAIVENADGNNTTKIVGTVIGQVGDTVGPISNVSIRVEGTQQGTYTQDDGTFKIDVAPGAILVFSYIGKKSKRIRITDKKTLNVNLDYDDENLDEVVLVAQRSDDDVINAGFGKVKKDQLGYDVKSIGDKDIAPIDTNVSTAATGKFSGVSVNPVAGLSESQIRTVQTILGNTNPLIVVDGIPISQSGGGSRDLVVSGVSQGGIESFMNPEDIADITILKSHAATNKYGTLGVNGVILITSKTGQAAKDLDSKRKAKPLGTTATYTGNAESLSELADTPYINALRITESVDEAYDVYIQERRRYGDRAEFYLDAAQYFKGWNNQFMTNRVLSNILEIAANDIPVLRALAYTYEAENQPAEAAKIYERILQLNTDKAQAYRDMALSYSDQGRAKDALAIYKQITSGASGKASFGAIQESLNKEARNFVRKHKTAVSTGDLDPTYRQQVGKLYKRIVIEWNDPKAEFDLQIVNPQKRYFTWPHTQKEAYQRMARETSEGFNMEEFFLTNGDKGQWSFNVVNYGFTDDDKGQPVFMKFTIYTDYGTPQERKETKLVRLSEIDKEINVLTINI